MTETELVDQEIRALAAMDVGGAVRLARRWRDREPDEATLLITYGPLIAWSFSMRDTEQRWGSPTGVDLYGSATNIFSKVAPPDLVGGVTSNPGLDALVMRGIQQASTSPIDANLIECPNDPDSDEFLYWHASISLFMRVVLDVVVHCVQVRDLVLSYASRGTLSETSSDPKPSRPDAGQGTFSEVKRSATATTPSIGSVAKSAGRAIDGPVTRLWYRLDVWRAKSELFAFARKVREVPERTADRLVVVGSGTCRGCSRSLRPDDLSDLTVKSPTLRRRVTVRACPACGSPAVGRPASPSIRTSSKRLRRTFGDIFKQRRETCDDSEDAEIALALERFVVVTDKRPPVPFGTSLPDGRHYTRLCAEPLTRLAALGGVIGLLCIAAIAVYPHASDPEVNGPLALAALNAATLVVCATASLIRPYLLAIWAVLMASLAIPIRSSRHDRRPLGMERRRSAVHRGGRRCDRAGHLCAGGSGSVDAASDARLDTDGAPRVVEQLSNCDAGGNPVSRGSDLWLGSAVVADLSWVDPVGRTL